MSTVSLRGIGHRQHQKALALEMRRGGWTAGYVAQRLGIPASTVRTWGKGLGIPTGVTPEQVARAQQVIDLYCAGFPIPEISERTGVSHPYTDEILVLARKRWVRFPKRKTNGEWDVPPSGRFIIYPIDIVNYRRKQVRR